MFTFVIQCFTGYSRRGSQEEAPHHQETVLPVYSWCYPWSHPEEESWEARGSWCSKGSRSSWDQGAHQEDKGREESEEGRGGKIAEGFWERQCSQAWERPKARWWWWEAVDAPISRADLLDQKSNVIYPDPFLEEIFAPSVVLSTIQMENLVWSIFGAIFIIVLSEVGTFDMIQTCTMCMISNLFRLWRPLKSVPLYIANPQKK